MAICTLLPGEHVEVLSVYVNLLSLQKRDTRWSPLVLLQLQIQSLSPLESVISWIPTPILEIQEPHQY